MIYHFSITSSTNDDARDEKYREGDVVWADFQTAGRGQRGHEWHSRKGENLTFSVVLEPTFVPIAEQFSVSEVVALSLVDMLAEYGIDAKIKWTNDIYVGDRKLVGILIEHSLAATTLRRTIVGIGININQTEFDSAIPNPVSMAQLLGRKLNSEEVLQRFLAHLQCNYNALREIKNEELEIKNSDNCQLSIVNCQLNNDCALHKRYNELLYRLNEWHTYALPTGERFQAAIRGTEPSGALKLEDKSGKITDYLFKEVEFIIF
ncbi:MAG: biotin--[acetyl-CoA-carboxylase] ligase [Rikenellaceae bacterium]|nr:biotin--[acetyl-CoA-carboxylase] ligase [Rikenellaceae bacterium]